jgi:Arc/MetJ-type ribon-helix-helix transcriptional regulator
MYYKGRYENRIKVIAQLLQKAQKENMRNGQLQEAMKNTRKNLAAKSIEYATQHQSNRKAK